MIKIPCVFVRQFADRMAVRATETVTAGCEWVLRGEGRATVKIDGTACLVRAGVLYKRYDAKIGGGGERKIPPLNSVPCQPEPDPLTGHWPHWVEVTERPEDAWHRSLARAARDLPDGTYELAGPRIGANPHRLSHHALIRHGAWDAVVEHRDLGSITEALRADPWFEGIVFHHPDGRMAKIRRFDVGLEWPAGFCLPAINAIHDHLRWNGFPPSLLLRHESIPCVEGS